MGTRLSRVFFFLIASLSFFIEERLFGNLKVSHQLLVLQINGQSAHINIEETQANKMLIANDLNILFHILRTFYSRSSLMSHRNINIDMQVFQSLEFASYQVDLIIKQCTFVSPYDFLQ